MRFLIAAIACLSLCAGALGAAPYFGIKVVDEQTGRGVPLVELETVNAVKYYTDSAGWVAFHEPGLMNREKYLYRLDLRQKFFDYLMQLLPKREVETPNEAK